MRKALLDRGLAPAQVELPLGPLATDGRRQGDHPVGRVGPPVEDDVLDVLEELGRNVFVDHELARVHDSHVEPRADRVVEEGRVDRLADDVVAAEREREVRDAAGDLDPRAALLDQRNRVDERLREVVVLLHAGRDREDVRVEDDVLGLVARLVEEEVVGPAADLHLPLDGVGLPLLVEGHDDDGGAEALYFARPGEELLLPLLEADRVDHALPLHALETRLDHRPARAVHHDRDTRDLGLGRDQVQEGRHRLLRLEQVCVHVDVEDVRAASHLLERDVDRALEVSGLDQLAEAGRPGHVRALPDHHEVRVAREREGLEPAQAGDPPRSRQVPRSQALDGGRDRAHVVGRRPAAAADDVDEPGLGKLTQEPARVVRLLVVAAEGVRKPGVRVAADVGGREPGEIRDVGPHLLRPERTVDPDDEGVRMLDRGPEGLDRLARERAAAPVDDRDRDPQRQGLALLLEDLVRSRDRGLRVQRVEDRLDEQEVDTAVDEPADLSSVALPHLVEGDAAKRGVLHLRRQRQRLVQRPDRPGHEPVSIGALVARLPREAGSSQVDVVDRALEPVVGLPDRGRRERVGGRDQRTGVEVGAMDVEDDVRAREVQEIRIALDVLRVLAESLSPVVRVLEVKPLEHRSPGAVEHDDALAEKLAEARFGGDGGSDHPFILPSDPRLRPCARDSVLKTKTPACGRELLAAWVRGSVSARDRGDRPPR